MKFIVENTSTGFSAYNDDDGDIIGTTGSNIPELLKNILEATNLHFEYKGRTLITHDDIELLFDAAE